MPSPSVRARWIAGPRTEPHGSQRRRPFLTPQGTAPRHKRHSPWPPALIRPRRPLRTGYPNRGKMGLSKRLIAWCRSPQCPLPSASGLGRLLAATPDNVRHGPDDVVRRSRFTCIAPSSRVAFAVAGPTASHNNAAGAWRAGRAATSGVPVPSDKGAEDMKQFERDRSSQGLGHWWTRPRSPKMNAHRERVNRTVREALGDEHEDLPFTELAEFNKKLAAWRGV